MLTRKAERYNPRTNSIGPKKIRMVVLHWHQCKIRTQFSKRVRKETILAISNFTNEHNFFIKIMKENFKRKKY